MLRYFAEAEHQHQFGADLGACPSCGTTRPEFIFDVLETPLRDLSGDIIYEENNRGQLVPARRYTPEFWRDKYEAFRLIQDVKQVSLRKESVAPLPAARRAKEKTGAVPLARRMDTIAHAPKTRLHQQAAQPRQSRHYHRGRAGAGAFNRRSSCVTPTAAPTISPRLITSQRFSFSLLIVAMFLGLTNSADDIIRDRVVLQRERNLNVRLPYYIFAKTVSLGRLRPGAMRSFHPYRQLHPRNPRDVLDLSRDRVHDRDGWRCAWPGRFLYSLPIRRRRRTSCRWY